tara:strand:+ start:2194 stop:2937 length:744 start_codon:yes stop_codon:yes gene_type:complete
MQHKKTHDSRPPVIIPKGMQFKFHGNFGGPGSGTKDKPVDALDKAFKKHDKAYTKNGFGSKKADEQLVKDLDKLLEGNKLDKNARQKATLAKAAFTNFRFVEREYIPKKKVVINTDGGARGNPGPAAIGYIIRWQEGTREMETFGAKTIGRTTNNVAEYVAAIEALKHLARTLGPNAGDTEVEIRTDSKLLAKQAKGDYRTKDSKLKTLSYKLDDARSAFKGVEFTFVKRKHNKEADALVNEAFGRR